MSVPGGLKLRLPYVTEELPGIGGAIRSSPESFSVVEVPAYDPIGHGDHVYLSVTKQSVTTRDTQIALARIFSLRREDIGHAGLKDKHALTTQTFSILLPRAEPSEVAGKVEEELGVRVNWFSRHPKKLRSGHLAGNAFRVIITDLTDPETAPADAARANDCIRRLGVPNFYGVQRIGYAGRNVEDGYALLRGEAREPNRWLRRYLVSSYLSYLCNLYLCERMERGLFTRILLGDLAKKHDTGGVFDVIDPAAEQPRLDAKQLSFTAPIYGYKMRQASGEAKELEDEVFASSGLTIEDLRRCGAEGTRRMGRLIPEVTVEPAPEGITLGFTLPAGGYATVVLREFMKNDEAALEAEPEPEEDEED